MKNFSHTVVLLLAATLLMVGCGGPRLQPLMPTPLLFSEMAIGPLDHIPENQRWNPRRVYYATTREREDDLQRIDYGNTESDAVSVGMSLVGFGGPNLPWSTLNDYSRRTERPEVVDLSIAGLVEIGHFLPGDGEEVRDVGGAAAWLMADLNSSIETARDRDLLIYVHGAKVNFYNASVSASARCTSRPQMFQATNSSKPCRR